MGREVRLREANEGEYLTVEEAAGAMGVMAGVLRNYLSSGKMTTYKFKTLTLVKVGEMKLGGERVSPLGDDTVSSPREKDKVTELREAIKKIESKGGVGLAGEAVVERRRYKEWSDEMGEYIVIDGTFEEWVHKYGKIKAGSMWKGSKAIIDKA